jgi:hypothetical protein
MVVMIIAAVAVNAQRTPVKTADLQKTITDNIAKDYAGFTIKEATKVVSNSVTTYEVVITKGTNQETLLYDNNGKFVKKVGASAGTTEKKNTTPTAHKHTSTTTQKKS